MKNEESDNREYLEAAARMVEKQAMENPGIGIPADPDVADFMGAFEDKALSEDDLEDTKDVFTSETD